MTERVGRIRSSLDFVIRISFVIRHSCFVIPIRVRATVQNGASEAEQEEEPEAE
jgi:hypothetical protein